jgi:hypothetical protein
MVGSSAFGSVIGFRGPGGEGNASLPIMEEASAQTQMDVEDAKQWITSRRAQSPGSPRKLPMRPGSLHVLTSVYYPSCPSLSP